MSDLKISDTTLSLTSQELAVLKQLIASGDRAGFYMAYYAMTGSQEAALQAKISTFSDTVGGFGIAAEIVESFAAYVANAAEHDPRKPDGDPMEWHRHRVHPELWKALGAAKTSLRKHSTALSELAAFDSDRKHYLSMRPAFSPIDEREPWT